MRSYTVMPCHLAGEVTPPPSKSQLHRLLIAAALAGQELPPPTLEDGEDIAATRRCLAALLDKGGGLPTFDCGESGSTLRFLIPLALALRGGGVFIGHGRLMERPLGPYFELFRQKHIAWSLKENVLTVDGWLSPGRFVLPGHVSSQFITGLLFALPLLGGESCISLSTPLESRPYVDLTLDVLMHSGIKIDINENTFTVYGNQTYQELPNGAEADWSQAAFWVAANFLNQQVSLRGLDPNSAQGDSIIARWYWQMARPGPLELDLRQTPDLLPPVALMAAVRAGQTRLYGAARLRDKESDRLAAVTQVLSAIGAQVEEQPDGLLLTGRPCLKGGVTVDPAGDHRIAMMAAVAASVCAEPVTILNVDCVKKSYPAFWEVYQGLGGKLDVSVSGK